MSRVANTECPIRWTDRAPPRSSHRTMGVPIAMQLSSEGAATPPAGLFSLPARDT